MSPPVGTIPEPVINARNVMRDVVACKSVRALPDQDAIVEHVVKILSAEEQAAMCSMFRLDGVEAALCWLNERFREAGDAPDEDLTFMPFRFVRIRPESARQTAVVEGIAFKREAGWHRVSRALARRLASEPENELNPVTSPKVFQVALTRIDFRTRVVELDA